MAVIIFGRIGSDAGYWYLGSDGKLHHVGGWGIEQMADLRYAITALEAAVQIKEPGVAETVTKGLMPFIERQLATHVKEGVGTEKGIIIVGGATARETVGV